MKQYNLDRWIFKIPLDNIIDENYKESKGENPCICCGKNVKNPRYHVHLLEDGNLVSTREDFINSQGFFPIGNTCKNKLPNNFYFDEKKYN